MRFLKHLLGRPPSGPNRATDLRGSEHSIDAVDFGPFEVLFSRDQPSYLSFLGMGSSNVQTALTSLRDIVTSSDDAHRYIALMLQGRNWRPHLVASVAALLSHERAIYVPVLWQTFDYGSWVAPQLAVVLYFSDAGFGREAKNRIASRCPVTAAPDLDDQFERAIRSKNFASLVRIVRVLDSEKDWAASELEHADVRALIRADYDSSGDIVDSWLDAVQVQFAKFGCDLRPPSTLAP